MKTVLNFIDTWGIRIMTLLVLTIFLKTCNTNSKIKNVSDNTNDVRRQVDSLRKDVVNLSEELKKTITIEGLKSEKRMIQSTDRKMLDVTRQTEIDKQISVLQK